MAGEFLSHAEIVARAEEIRVALSSLMLPKSLVGKPSADQWGFFEACGERLLSPEKPSEFDQGRSSRSAQLKFEVEDKLRRYYNHPGKFVDYVFSLAHKGKLPGKQLLTPEYPNLAGYCLLVRAVREDYLPVKISGRISRRLSIVHTTEYWYLRWWDTKKLSYVYPYRETNRQTYILKQENGVWKVFQNLRPSPRSSAPN